MDRRFTSFYGYPETSRRAESLQQLRGLKNQEARLWLCIGDFNEIIVVEEKVGAKGPKFTWLSGHGNSAIFDRLDRSMAIVDWMGLFLYSLELHEPTSTSDHLPIILEFDSRERS
ncbi:hypothetical protein DITRI_Ditri11bG0008600 [Diplodiscus trichospermus]